MCYFDVNRFIGSAGQSFACFLTPGMNIQLVGEANDYVGKVCLSIQLYDLRSWEMNSELNWSSISSC